MTIVALSKFHRIEIGDDGYTSIVESRVKTDSQRINLDREETADLLRTLESCRHLFPEAVAEGRGCAGGRCADPLEETLNVGDPVQKVPGSYNFRGHVVGIIRKRSGSVRAVVENQDRILDIFRPGDLRKIHDP